MTVKKEMVDIFIFLIQFYVSKCVLDLDFFESFLTSILGQNSLSC